MLIIAFFDTNKELIKTYQQIIKSDKVKLFFINDNVESMLKTYKFDAIVSPANSFGNMNGGIDRVYKKIFNNVEKDLTGEINKLKLAESGIGYYIPIGKNIVVKVNHKGCSYMISAPTMFVPKDINGTKNVYLAFYGIMERCYGKDLSVACPGLGTSIGAMSYVESAQQINQAINDYIKK
jgi:O-acetyl-ADP-ribose deacetylase (regulator of RNase III)